MNSFFTLMLTAALVVPAAATAQTPHRRSSGAAVAPQASTPQTGVPLPRLGLAPVGTGFQHIVPFHDGEFPGTEFARVKHLNSLSSSFSRQPFFSGAPARRRSFGGTPVLAYAVPYIVAVDTPAVPPLAAVAPEKVTTGSLVLQVEPETAQVFVDGYYFGMPQDFDGRRGELELEAGTHKLELLAPDYESVTLDVKIAASQQMKYNTVMKAAVAPPAPTFVSSAAPKIFYLVPGCYLGDVPPKDAGLPATCDVSRMITFGH